MGVIGLWKILAPAGEEDSFDHYIVEKYKQGGAEMPVKIGIDASIWFNELQYPSNTIGTHAQHGENPELTNFTYRLSHLLRLPVSPLFVFDGNGRAQKKRGVTVKTKDHWLTSGFQDFIERFGFNFHVAPGEAEAELAKLNKDGIIDAVLTEDSDALLFGAQTVIRGGAKANDSAITVFTADRIRTHPSTQLDLAGLYLMALLCGCDYYDGLKGCAAATAHKLALCEYSPELKDILDRHDDETQQRDIRLWLAGLRLELLTDIHNRLGRRYPNLWQRLDNEGLDVLILKHYTRPLVSNGPFGPDHVFNRLGMSNIDVQHLAELVRARLGWGNDNIIEAKFKKYIWPGVVFRAMTRNENICKGVPIFHSLHLTPLCTSLPRQQSKKAAVQCILVVADLTYGRSLILRNNGQQANASTLSRFTTKVKIFACAIEIFYRRGNYMMPGSSSSGLLAVGSVKAMGSRSDTERGSANGIDSRSPIFIDFD